MSGVKGSDIAATLTIIALAACAALGPRLLRRLEARPSAEECAALLDRYVELVARAASPSPAASAIADRKALARAAAADHGVRGVGPACPDPEPRCRTRFARCETELTRDEVSCGLRAGNADELERCLP